MPPGLRFDSSAWLVTKMPGRLTPGVGKVDDKQPDKHHGRPAGTAVRIKRVLVRPNDTRDDEVANGHADTTRDEDLLPADVVDPDDGGDCKDELEDASHAGGQELGSVTAQVQILEDLGTVGS